jgi:hypothetical protein
MIVVGEESEFTRFERFVSRILKPTG